MPKQDSGASFAASLLNGNTAGELIPKLERHGLQQLNELEVTAVIGAGRHGRTEDRLGNRNRYRPRSLAAQVGRPRPVACGDCAAGPFPTVALGVECVFHIPMSAAAGGAGDLRWVPELGDLTPIPLLKKALRCIARGSSHGSIGSKSIPNNFRHNRRGEPLTRHVTQPGLPRALSISFAICKRLIWLGSLSRPSLTLTCASSNRFNATRSCADLPYPIQSLG